VTVRDWAGEGELGVLQLAQCLEDMGALDNVGPEVFSAQLNTMDPTTVGRLCQAKTDEFLAKVRDRS
jgi:hypothetical protein